MKVPSRSGCRHKARAAGLAPIPASSFPGVLSEQPIGFRYLADGSCYPVYGEASDSLARGGASESCDGGLLIPVDAPDLAIIVECPGGPEAPA